MTLEFKNFDPKMTYRSFLYKKENGQVISKIFEGEDAVQAAVDEGWVLSPSAFVDEEFPEMPKAHRDQVKERADIIDKDITILANAEEVDDEEFLREVYERVSGRKPHGRIRSLEGLQAACKKLLGDLHGNSH